MSTTVTPEASGQGGYQPPPTSLEAAALRLTGLLSHEETEPPAKAPEQSSKAEGTPPEAAASATEQAPAAPDTGSEQATSEDEESPPAPTTYKAKVNGQEVEVTLDEALKGYSRTEDYTRKTQQLSQERKSFEAEMQQVRAERTQYLTGLTSIEQTLKDLAPAEPNWAHLRQSLTPEQYADQRDLWAERQKRLDGIAAERARIEGLQQQDAARQFQTHLAQERELLHAALPEFADPTTGPQVRSSLYDYAKGLGFSDEQIGSATTNHKVVLLLHKAMQYDQAQAKKPAVQNKIEKVLATPAPGNRAPAPKASKLDQAKTRLQQTGSMDDAARAIEQLLG